jgi:hypothetical protein
MDRRLIGALLVVAVVAVAIVVPARDGLRIAGRGTTIDLPADPQVGDCLLMAQSFGPCAGQSAIGEVVWIVTATGDPYDRLVRAESSGTDCRAVALTYAGLTEIDGRYVPRRHQEPDPVDWKFSINVRTTWVLPSAQLRAAGRTWAACVVEPSGGTSYPGGLGDAYSSGRLPDAYGVCWSAREVAVAMHKVDCAEPHLAELIAIGSVAGDDVTPTEISGSCQSLAAEVMGRSDPTADGGLAVRIDPDAADSLRWTREAMGVVCYVVPTAHSLTGTLVGLRDRPVPYSG